MDAAGIQEQFDAVQSQDGEAYPFDAVTHDRYHFLKKDFEHAAEIIAPVAGFAEKISVKFLSGLCRGLAGDIDAYLDGLHEAIGEDEFPAFYSSDLHGPWFNILPSGCLDHRRTWCPAL